MEAIDFIIFGLYMVTVVAIGYYFYRKNSTAEDYYVGSRSIKASHVGLSVVATDVGGGFSIGLGGVGFMMGLAGTWLLFTGLVGAWLTAVLVIPRIKAIDAKHAMYTYPDFLKLRYGGKVAILASLISGIGYLGFTGAQIRAGAKLASATLIKKAPFGMDPIDFAIYAIAVITILYTVLGGIKAVIYTDTFQWMVLILGLACIAVPATLIKLGGFSVLLQKLPKEYFSFGNISLVKFLNWMITIIPIWFVAIIPIWFVAMTLYQRMYACKDAKEAKKAWYVAGLFEYPVMAFIGVFLGMCSRIFFPEVQAEMGLPLLIQKVLPIGVKGIVVAAFFSAIMSTADSCLMAASGNFVNDFIQRFFLKNASQKKVMRVSQFVTLLIGIVAVLLASHFEKVLDAIMYAYGFMVAGLFVPTLGAFFFKKGSSKAAYIAMLTGGGFTISCLIMNIKMPYGLHVSFFGILLSAVTYLLFSFIYPDKDKRWGDMASDKN